MTPQEWVDRWSRGGGRCGPAWTSPTTTSSAPPSRGTRRRCESSSRPCTTRPGRHRARHLRGPVLRGVRGCTTRRTSSSTASAPIHGRPVEPHAGGELLLPALSLRGPAARALRGASRGRAAGDPAQRGARAHPRRASRTSPSAGRRSGGASRCPGTRRHVNYVWFDALTNYITAAGYGSRPGPVRPAVAGEHPPDRQGHPPLPRGLLAGHADGRRPRAARRRSGPTASCRSAARRCPRPTPPASTRPSWWTSSASTRYRYYFLREIQFGQDGSFSWEAMVDRYNADLANGLGNLASRVLAMFGSYFGGVVPEAAASGVPRATSPPWSRTSPAATTGSCSTWR